MKAQRAIIAGGTALAILIIFLIFFSTVWKPDSVKTLTCDPPPVSIYGLLNEDRNLSHSFHIRITNTSNLTIGEESYYLAPGEYIESKIQEFNKNTTYYYLTFTVDGNLTYQREVNASTYIVQSFDYNPEKNGIVSGVLFHSDYSCKINTH